MRNLIFNSTLRGRILYIEFVSVSAERLEYT